MAITTNGYNSSIQREFPVRSSNAVKSASLLRTGDMVAAARGANITVRNTQCKEQSKPLR